MVVDVERQSSTQGPAQPNYIFRGHTAQIHSVLFVRRNTCLITGDAEGWVVYWKLETKRPLAVWRAHDGAILGTAEWGPEKIVTHGRDHNLRIWQLRSVDGSRLSTLLPADGSTAHRPKPWLLHSLPVNTLNFCAFSMCYSEPASGISSKNAVAERSHSASTRGSESIFVAVPARDDKKIEVYQFPQESLVSVVPRVEPVDTGMTMAVKLAFHGPTNNTLVIAGYEGGFTAVHLLPRILGTTRKSIPRLAQTVYLSQAHTQPVLGIDASPDCTTFFASSADAVISAHQIPELPPYFHDNDDFVEDLPTSTTIDESSDQPSHHPSTQIASNQVAEAKSVVTSGPVPGSSEPPTDASLNTTRPIPSASIQSAVDEEGIPTNENGTEITSGFSENSLTPSTAPTLLSFTKQTISSPPSTTSTPKPGGLSSLLSSAGSQTQVRPSPPPLPTVTVQPPYKSTDTKHAGQQSVRVRSDGRLLVTGGWDSRVRVYSAKTFREMAVLKWHKEGVYAVDFGDVLEAKDLMHEAGEVASSNDTSSAHEDSSMTRRETGLSKLQRQREEQMQLKHWVVAGAKDGKVSLWEVF